MADYIIQIKGNWPSIVWGPGCSEDALEWLALKSMKPDDRGRCIDPNGGPLDEFHLVQWHR